MIMQKIAAVIFMMSQSGAKVRTISLCPIVSTGFKSGNGDVDLFKGNQ